MKRVSFVLAMLFACVSGICTPVYAIRPGIRMVANSFLKSLDTDDHDDQKLFEELRQKMGLDGEEISLVLEKKDDDESSCGSSQALLFKGENTFSVVLSNDDQLRPRNQRAFVLAHELAHIKNGHIKNVAAKVRSGLIREAYFENAISCLCEKQADLMAIAMLKDKTSAMHYFEASRKKNLEKKRASDLSNKEKKELVETLNEFEEDINQFRDKVDKDVFTPRFKRTIRDGMEMALETLKEAKKKAVNDVDEDGNNLLDEEHPLLTERIAYCNAALQDPSLCKIQYSAQSAFQIDSAQSEREGLKAIIACSSI